MTFRVIQWATGGVGKAAIEGILDHPELELVGCWVHDPAKAGRDAGELAGRAPIGVRRIGLGPRILRVETAAIAIAAWATFLARP